MGRDPWMVGPLLRVKTYFVPPKGADVEQTCMDCDTVWIKAANGTNSLSYEKAIPYILDLKVADPDDDGIFTTRMQAPAPAIGLGLVGNLQR